MRAISIFFISFLVYRTWGQIKPSMVGIASTEKDENKKMLDVSQMAPLKDVSSLSVQLDITERTMVFEGSVIIDDNSYFYGVDNESTTINLIESSHTDGKKCYTGSIVNEKAKIIQHLACDINGNNFVSSISISDFSDEEEIDEEMIIRQDTYEDEFASLTQASIEDGSKIDVMVVWTKLAECKYSRLGNLCTQSFRTEENMKGLINLAITETNIAFAKSGITTALNLVHSYRHPSYVEALSLGTTLEEITSINGIADDIHDKREQFRADIVVLIAHNPQACGVGWIGPRIDLMFSVSAWHCATGYYTFGHEIAHNFGCSHDRGTADECFNNKFSYGYRNQNAEFRSIMAYNCVQGQCDNNVGGGCIRVQRFSNSEFLYNGKQIGNASNDNAKQINENIFEVANYFTPGSATTSPSGTNNYFPSGTNSPSTKPKTVFSKNIKKKLNKQKRREKKKKRKENNKKNRKQNKRKNKKWRSKK